ncbi:MULTISPECIES: PEP/pyruvate-binding domain-containing protein [unclassified Xenorhabdus]|uniref:PEP/pyruvate-binding domain-containing protein n=1 Tax=Xenorhabdus TaxID=626 RepID=UPI00255818AB|nr:PEP/pyruvate-binding domain-containing protein [Xenorhabdus sp. SF857]WFQ79798.1 PEP/pyruvate-binding domain-containing protein [Xenorhabdus sp. SF857]
MKIIPLIDATILNGYGGKAYNLSKALRASLPVPSGYVLSPKLVNLVALNDPRAIEYLKCTFDKIEYPVAVRSSASDEDNDIASFAGQHKSILNVNNFEQLLSSIIDVKLSGQTQSALDYRSKLGMSSISVMAVIIQKMIEPRMAGVMFTRDPVTKRKEFVIESAWGVGEVVVSGLVVPDSYRVSEDGILISSSLGYKDTQLRLRDNGYLQEVNVDEAYIEASSLSPKNIDDLYQLGCQCEKLYGDGLDIEWCISNDYLYLLQCRTITV